MKTFLAIVLALVAFWILKPVIGFVLGLLFGLVNLATGLLYLAVLLGIVIFLAGLIRRLLRV